MRKSKRTIFAQLYQNDRYNLSINEVKKSCVNIKTLRKLSQKQILNEDTKFFATNKEPIKVTIKINSIAVNRIPKSVCMTPIKWYRKSIKKIHKCKKAKPRLCTIIMMALSKQRIFKTIIQFLPYDEYINYCSYFPFCNRGKYKVIIKQIIAIQIIFV